MKQHTFRNVFAIIIWVSTIVLFGLHGAGLIKLPEMIIGSLLTTNALVVQFYFRKRPADERGGQQ